MLIDHEKMVNARLDEWARFFLSNPLARLNYPRMSIYMQELIGKGVSHRGEPENPRAEEIERWVSELAMEEPKWAEALRDKYFASDHTTSYALARRRGIGTNAFDVRIKHAKLYLWGRMSENLYHRQQKNLDTSKVNRI